MHPLQLPPTIYTPTREEVPNYPETIEAINRRTNAKIVEGFSIKRDYSNELGYKFFAEINVDNDKLWTLFKTLTLQMPEEIALVYGYIDIEPSYGRYLDKYELLNNIEEYNIELTQDGFLEFGVIFNTENYLEEIFVKKAKYIQYWGVGDEKFMEIMEEFGLLRIDDMKFIDEFPMATISLRSLNPDVKTTEVVIDEFNKMFK